MVGCIGVYVMAQEAFQRSIQSHNAVKRASQKPFIGGTSKVSVRLTDDATEEDVSDICDRAEEAGGTKAEYNSVAHELCITIDH